MIMKKLALPLIILALAFVSCKKQAENKLNGTWNVIKTSDFIGEEFSWEFSENGNLKVTYPNYPAVITEARYEVISKNMKNHIRISGLDSMMNNFEPMNADWQILKLNGSQLKIAHDKPTVDGQGKGLVYREFIR